MIYIIYIYTIWNISPFIDLSPIFDCTRPMWGISCLVLRAEDVPGIRGCRPKEPSGFYDAACLKV